MPTRVSWLQRCNVGCRKQSGATLTLRAAHRGFQSFLLLIPAGVFDLRSQLQSLYFDLGGRGFLCML